MFRVGDRVRHSDGAIGTVVEDFLHDSLVTVHYNDEYGTCTDHYSDVIPIGPVREVTRREIVPGNYGKVRVTEGRYVHCKSMSTAEELREAAHILNQIAEAME